MITTCRLKLVRILLLAPTIVGVACNTIRVSPVDYTFKTPLVALPLGLKSPIDRRDAFAQVFCKALPVYGVDSEGNCRKYLELDGYTSDGSSLPTLLAKDYQVVVVAGIFSACLPRNQVSIYKQGIAQLKQEGLAIEEIPVSATGGTAEHAKTIAKYIQDHQGPPFIAIGYSQGAADLLDAYVNEQVVHDSMKALVTIAGAVGGSRLPDGIPKALGQILGGIDISLPDCQIKGLAGLDALRRNDRYDFLSDHRDRLPRAYSIAAKSSKQKTSKILQGPWQQLSAYSIDQDSQVIRDDAVVPGGSFLATALADHWAVTLPFAEAHDPLFDKLVDQSPYPRTALLEATIRFVMKDLKEKP